MSEGSMFFQLDPVDHLLTLRVRRRPSGPAPVGPQGQRVEGQQGGSSSLRHYHAARSPKYRGERKAHNRFPWFLYNAEITVLVPHADPRSNAHESCAESWPSSRFG